MQALYATLYIITSIWCVNLACIFCQVRQGFHVSMHTPNVTDVARARRLGFLQNRSSPSFADCFAYYGSPNKEKAESRPFSISAGS